MAPGKNPAIAIKIFTDVSEADRAGATLVVRISDDPVGLTVIRREVHNPPPAIEMNFPTDALDWGAYTVNTVIRRRDGSSYAGDRTIATVLPGGSEQLKILNNFVTELVDFKEGDTARRGRIAFMNPRDGWCFFASRGNASLRLNDESAPILGGQTVEAMRRLPAGRHTLHIDGEPEALVVRAIPILQYVGYDNEPYIAPHGPYDWAFLQRDVLPNINVMISHAPSRAFAHAAVQSGGTICLERYLWEEPTLEAAKRNIRNRLLSEWNMPRFEALMPGVTRRTVMVLGYISAPTESLNINPGVDFKVYMDMQMQLLATAPDYFGLGGVQQYLVAYSDEENIRWAGRVFRANASTARLTVSDWRSKDDPGGDVGQALIYDFIEVQPYFQQ